MTGINLLVRNTYEIGQGRVRSILDLVRFDSDRFGVSTDPAQSILDTIL